MTTEDLTSSLVAPALEPTEALAPESIVEPIVEPAAEAIAEPVPEPVAEPVAEAAAQEPAVEAVAEPMLEEAVAERVVVEAAAEPVSAEAPAAPAPVAAKPTSIPFIAKPKPPLTPEQLAQQEAARERAAAVWIRISGAKESGESISGRVRSEVKGGLILDVEGFRAFLPASQTRIAKGEPLTTLVNTVVPVKVLDVDDKRKRLVVSHRRAMESDRRAARASLLQSLTIGETREAKVVRLADFGAFVDLGGVDALVPIGELAFERVEKVSDVVNVGDTFTVKVLRIDEGGRKIAASRKGALADPWRDHGDLLKTGNVVEGKVVGKEPRLQVEIAPGVVGSISDRDADPAEYEIGEAVEVTVRGVDYRQRRLRLSTLHVAQTFTSSGFAPLGKELGV
jgi:predicted RNA-binding protein with RPS1 domain